MARQWRTPADAPEQYDADSVMAEMLDEINDQARDLLGDSAVDAIHDRVERREQGHYA